MKQRIKLTDLQGVVNRINRLTGSPAAAYARGADGALEAQIGAYYIDECYGGVMLAQMVNAGGGIRDVCMTGYVPKRTLYNALFAYIAGLDHSAERAPAATVGGL